MTASRPFASTDPMEVRSPNSAEFFCFLARSTAALTAFASTGSPSLNFRPGRRRKVTWSPLSLYSQLSARSGTALPLSSVRVNEAYTRASSRNWAPLPLTTGSQCAGK